ncbi:hypothetical protein BN135_337 [Cronobacter muytjensii 530]
MPVFGGDKRIHQQIREAGARHKQALFAIRRRKHGNQARIEAEETEVTVAVHIFDSGQVIAVKLQPRADLPFFTVREIERTADHLDAVGLNGKLARARHFRHLTILRRLQQLHHLLLADGHIRLKVDHTAIDRRRQLPDFAINTAADFLIQIDAVDNKQHHKNHKQL